MTYNPYEVAGAATDWMEDYFKLSRKQKEAIALGKQQKGIIKHQFSKEVREIEKSMAKSHSKRKKGFFEKIGDAAPIATTIVGAITGNAPLMAWGAGFKGGKKGYDIHQQSKHTKRRSQRSIDAMNKVMKNYRNLFIQPESRLGPSKDEMIARRDAAKDMGNPLNILLQSAVEGGKTYAMGKMASEAGSNMFTKTTTPGNIPSLSKGIDWSPDVVTKSFTPFKALASGNFLDDEGANMMALLISQLLQEGMDS